MYSYYEKYLDPRDDYLILLDDLEFAMSKEQLKRITNLHNSGVDLEDIAEQEDRDPYEVIIALLHVARRAPKQIKRPFAYRRR